MDSLPTAPARLRELDGLRALAVALVVGCHYPVAARSFWGLPELGWLGVEIFFVLSGYLITTRLLALRGREDAFRVFYSRRIRRILPPYYLVLAVCLALAWSAYAQECKAVLLVCVPFLTSFVNTPQIVADLGHLMLHPVQAISAVAAREMPEAIRGMAGRSPIQALGPLWSVSIEEWFYLLWAPVVLVFRRRSMVAAIAIVSAFAMLFRLAGVTEGSIWYQDFFCRVDTIILGAGLALWIDHVQFSNSLDQARARRLPVYVGILAGVALAAVMAFLWPFVGREVRTSATFAAVGTPLIGLATAGLLCFLVHGSGGRALACRVLRAGPVVWVGRRSYMIYLSHAPFYWMVSHFFGSPAQIHPLLTAVGALTLTVGWSALSWRFIEAPLLDGSKTKKVQSRPRETEVVAVTTPGSVLETEGK